jgi:hypothetical protein
LPTREKSDVPSRDLRVAQAPIRGRAVEADHCSLVGDQSVALLPLDRHRPVGAGPDRGGPPSAVRRLGQPGAVPPADPRAAGRLTGAIGQPFVGRVPGRRVHRRLVAVFKFCARVCPFAVPEAAMRFELPTEVQAHFGSSEFRFPLGKPLTGQVVLGYSRLLSVQRVPR